MVSVPRLVPLQPALSIVGITCLGLALLGSLSGCGRSGAPEKLTVYEVKGKLLLANGKPLNGGHVYFVPTDESARAPRRRSAPTGPSRW